MPNLPDSWLADLLLAETEGDNAARKASLELERRKLAERSLAYFIRRYGLLVEPVHKNAPIHKQIDSLLDNRNIQDIAGAAPRGSGKSTRVRAYALKEHLIQPQITFVIFASNDLDVAKKHLAWVKDQIRSNEAILSEFGDLHHMYHWREEEIGVFKPDAENMAKPWYRRKWTLFKAMSPRQKSGLRGVNHLGQRPQIIIMDDPELDSEHRVAEDASNFGYWAFAKLYPARDPVYCRRIWIGNFSFDDTMLGQLLQGMPFTGMDLKPYGDADPDAAAEHAEWSRFKWDCYQPDGSSYWNDRFPIEKLKATEAEYESSGFGHLFSAEYRNTPISAKSAVFQKEWFGPGWIYGAAPEDGEQAQNDYPGISIIGGVDPAISETEKADYFAVATGGIWTPPDQEVPEVLLFDVEQERIPFPDQVDHLFDLYERWGWAVLGVEAVAFQTAVQQAMDRAALIHHKDVIVEPIKAKGKKEVRFKVLAERFKSKVIRAPFSKSRPGLNRIFTSYKRGVAHDDILDATDIMVRTALTWGGEESAGAHALTGLPPDERAAREKALREQMIQPSFKRRGGGMRKPGERRELPMAAAPAKVPTSPWG